MDNTNDYQKALDTAHAEMTVLLAHHAALEKRIAKLRQIIATLASLNELTDEDDDDVSASGLFDLSALSARAAVAGTMKELMGINMALSDAIREVLKASGKAMTAVQVRDGLIRMGGDPDKYTNQLAVIHRALKRLEEKGEVTTGASADGKSTYQWKTGFILEPRPRTRKQERLAKEAAEPQLLTRRQIRHAKETAEREGGKPILDLYKKAKD